MGANASSSWPTARTVRGGYTRDKGDPTKARLTLEGLAQNWPTPAARDHKGTNSTEHVETNGSGRMHLDQLPNFVAYCLPPLFQGRSIPDGAMSSTAGHNLPPPSTRRQLNPYFVEALMRWPSGLSGFARAETAWTRWWALMPGFVLALCSDSIEPAGPAQGQLL